MGTDYANWTPPGGSKATFCFSELFSRGPGDWHRGGGRGFHGPLMLSRGWGISQATRGTFVPGVTPKGRAQTVDGFQWILGLPVPPDNSKVVMPEFIGSTVGAIRNGVGILRNKFDRASKKSRDCTFEKVGGKRFDCPSCLARFDLKHDFVKVGKRATSYRLDADEDRFIELFNEPRPEGDLVEYPCSWLTAIMRYAGAGDRAFNRLKKTAKKVTNPPAGSNLEHYLGELKK